MRRPLTIAAAVLAAAGAATSGCKEIESEEAAGYEPAHVEEVKGASDDLKRVEFTAEGAARTGLKVAPVRRAGQHSVVPYEALIYDADGGTWVYTNPGKLTYLRQEVKVDRIEGQRVLVTAGPAVGTPVVTTGAVEVYGAELEIAGSH